MNLLTQGLAVQAQQVAANKSNVVPFPTQKLAQELHTQGKKIVHKPAELETFRRGVPFDGPEAA